MGIQIEFNPDLALRAYNTPNRSPEECLPSKLEIGGVYEFLKKGYRTYWVEGAVPLYETKGNGDLSRPLAAISIHEPRLVRDDALDLWTHGIYVVHALFDPTDTSVYFEGMSWLGTGNTRYKP